MADYAAAASGGIGARGEHVHLTAEEVHQAAQALVPELSLATVYNTLNELVVMGELLEVRASRGPARYDPNVGAAHHHLVCRECGAIFDVLPSGVDGLGLEERAASRLRRRGRRDHLPRLLLPLRLRRFLRRTGLGLILRRE